MLDGTDRHAWIALKPQLATSERNLGSEVECVSVEMNAYTIFSFAIRWK